MPNERLVKAINTPPIWVLKDLEESELIDLEGQKIHALFLGAGGYGKAYLYHDPVKQEYRVAKVYHPNEEMGLGDIEHRVTTFNNIYSEIYNGALSTLATACRFNQSQMILDMPYIGGVDYFNRADKEEVHARKIQNLLSYFKQHSFFVADYQFPGNVIQFLDPATEENYILVRDVDIVGRRNSFQQNGENSITFNILNYQLPFLGTGEIHPDEFKAIVTTPSTQESKQEPSKESQNFHYLKSLLLAKIKPKHSKYAALANAKDFQELCFLAAQKRKKHFFSQAEGFTEVLGHLHSLIKKEKANLKDLRTHFKLADDFNQYDLQEIGFYGKLRLKNDNVKLREKNLKYIYSVHHNHEGFKSKLASLREYSIFSWDFKTLLPPAPTEQNRFLPSFLRTKKR